MAGKNKVKADRTATKLDVHQPQMKIVGADTCIACPTPCARGIAYREKMEKPGAIGFGVPCILTLK
ncbi:hypothetical protein [Effusibacillus dendaii]|uniref:Uncharacterized protein n=1 Tax=Effusibacillus dendaii TaxID=2743772 RepID=A0A7I8DB55_9BACL|nr:hypothetical protein [Effusibacillus dendaii]BCJ86582.1 hypothetical protein skT53_15670 [Effusibacillus dendaii]